MCDGSTGSVLETCCSALHPTAASAAANMLLENVSAVVWLLVVVSVGKIREGCVERAAELQDVSTASIWNNGNPARLREPGAVPAGLGLQPSVTVCQLRGSCELELTGGGALTGAAVLTCGAELMWGAELLPTGL